VISFTVYLAAGLSVLASHVVLSAPSIRPTLIRRLGRPGFVATYSALSVLTLAAFVWAYRRVPSGPWLFEPAAAGPLFTLILMPLAVFLIVGRLTTLPQQAPVGVYRISRYPGSVGVLLWAYLHLVNMGDARRAVLFGVFLLIPLAAILKNELVRRSAVRRGTSGEDEQTRIVPFHAVLSGRDRLAWSEIGWWRVGSSLLVYAALLLLHPVVFGVDPLTAADLRWP